MKIRGLFLLILIAGAITLAVLLLRGYEFPLVQPAGPVGAQQRNLLLLAVVLSLIVIIPVFVMAFAFAWKYREGNKKAKYKPNWDHHLGAELTWWGIPCAIIAVLIVVTWQSSHALDPYRPLDSKVKPVTVQVVALDWKWLFIYPEYDIATVNLVQFPEKTPINFEITADAPMNSFWIPSLGGQIYAMAGMVTKLHLMADKPGSYNGVSANISGEGFAGMRFEAKASTRSDFDNWVRSVKQSKHQLTMDTYNELAKPTKNHPVTLYSSEEDGLYDKVVMKFMHSEPGANLQQPYAQPPAAHRDPAEAHRHEGIRIN